MFRVNIEQGITILDLRLQFVMGDPEVTANIYCKSRNLPNTDTQNYSTDLRYLLGHPVTYYMKSVRISNPTLFNLPDP